VFIAVESLAEAIHEGVIEVDHNFCISFSNRRSQILFRRSREELHQLPLWSLMATDANPVIEREVRRAIEQQVNVEFDVFYPSLYMWHEVRCIPSPTGLTLILRDITDRQWLIHREAERTYLKNLFQDAPVAISVMRGPDHQIEFLNDLARQIIGDREVQGLTTSEAFPELAGQGIIELLDHVYTTGESHHSEEQLVQFEHNGQVDERYFTFTYQPLRGFDAQIAGVLTINVEVTHQVRARQQSEQIATRRAAVLEHLADGVIVTDVDGNIIFINEVAAELHGTTQLNIGPDDYSNTYQLLTVDGEPHPVETLPLTRAVRNHEVVQNARWRILRPDGENILVEGSASPMFAPDGTKLGAVLTIRCHAD
jgi:PAS domain S-box-containing protein